QGVAQLYNADPGLIRDGKSDSRTAIHPHERHRRLLIIPPHFGDVTETYQTGWLSLADQAATDRQSRDVFRRPEHSRRRNRHTLIPHIDGTRVDHQILLLNGVANLIDAYARVCQSALRNVKIYALWLNSPDLDPCYSLHET